MGESYLLGIVRYAYLTNLVVNTVDGVIHNGQQLTNRGNGPPAEQLSDGSTDIWETLSVLNVGMRERPMTLSSS